MVMRPCQKPELALSDRAITDAKRLDLIARANETRAAPIRQRLAETEHALAETRAALAAAQAGLAQNAQVLDRNAYEIARLGHFERGYNSIVESTLWRSLQPVKRVFAQIPRPVVGMLRRSLRGTATPPPPDVLPEPLPAPELPPESPVLDEDPGFTLADITPPRTGYLPLIQWFDPVAPEVSIIVYNRGGGAGTLQGLQHLWQNTTGHHYEIIILDNGSAPDEIERLQAEAPLVRVIPFGGGPYFGEAHNLVIEASQGRYVCLLDSASFVMPGWLEPLIQALSGDEAIGAAGASLVQPDGIVLDGGWMLDPNGSVSVLTSPVSRDRLQIVDALSAACLLMRRADFIRVLGFDLAWDPGSYETADLCLKLRLIGLRSACCPGSVVMRLGPKEDGVSADVVALNRAKFVDRWGPSLNTMWQRMPDLVPEPEQVAPRRGQRPHVLIYTPYPLTPGGGERYILTIAQALAPVADVTLVTSYPVSRSRLRTMGRVFELDVGPLGLTDIASLGTMMGDGALRDGMADLAIVLGNELLPTAPAMARHNIYICQFPFPFEHEADRQARLAFWGGYELILTYSDYVRTHVLRQIEAAGLPFCPVDVLHPPAPMITRRAAKRHGQILNVGRFFAGGHCKRQDAMIDAFRQLIEAGAMAELHFAGSTMPEPVHQAYYAGLVERAAGLPVTFHPNCSADALQDLYAESDLYWHATGIGRDVEQMPHVVEHFGISIVEAMSARCVPIVFAAGGPGEIVQDGVTGFHVHSVDELSAVTRRLLDSGSEHEPIRAAAELAAKSYDEDTFTRRVLELAARVMET